MMGLSFCGLFFVILSNPFAGFSFFAGALGNCPLSICTNTNQLAGALNVALRRNFVWGGEPRRCEVLLSRQSGITGMIGLWWFANQELTQKVAKFAQANESGREMEQGMLISCRQRSTLFPKQKCRTVLIPSS